jgi:hypothetical protein
MIELETADGLLFAASNTNNQLPLLVYAWCNQYLDQNSFSFDLDRELWLFKKFEDVVWFEMVWD